jgi:hypothetical protein
MPSQTTRHLLRHALKPGLTIGNNQECRVDASAETVHISAVSEDRSVSMEHSIPQLTPQSWNRTESTSFWIDIQNMAKFTNINTSKFIEIIYPFETSNSTILLRSETLKYRFQSLNPKYTDTLPDLPVASPKTKITLPHYYLARAVQCANLVGGLMHIDARPQDFQVEFSARAQYSTDEFSITLSNDHVADINGSATSLTIPIDLLRDIVPLVPTTKTVYLQLSPSFLIYNVEFPVSEAELELSISKLTQSDEN